MNNGSVSRDEWQLFTQLPSNTQAERALDGDIPKWVSQQVWKVTHCMSSKVTFVAGSLKEPKVENAKSIGHNLQTSNG